MDIFEIEEKLRNADISFHRVEPHILEIQATDWQRAWALESSARFVALWAEDFTSEFQVHAGVEREGSYLFLRAKIHRDTPDIASIASIYPAASRLERHTSDLFGIRFLGHPDPRRWTRHGAWNEEVFPLRKDFSVETLPSLKTPPDVHYPFVRIEGAGIYEIPVGPVHAGIIEPGHFRFQTAGEEIFSLEEHLGYTHKGIEKIAENRNIPGLLKLAARVSGDSTVAYTWATLRACEQIYSMKIPMRACFIRALLSERERVANHLGDMAAICNDVGFGFAYYQLMRLKEDWLRANATVFGHRLMMDVQTLGGVLRDISPVQVELFQQQNQKFQLELEGLFEIFERNSSLHDRLKTTGVLEKKDALRLGVVGYAGRASGVSFDIRAHAPYPPYDQLEVKVPLYENGDVLSRCRIRGQEILISLEWMRQMLQQLPEGPVQISESEYWLHGGGEAMGLIEGWRGEILVYVRLNEQQRVERFFPRDPSWFLWPALEGLIHGNIVPDFPVCNKSINGSYSGVDL